MALVVVVWGFGPTMLKLVTGPAVVVALYRFWISVPLLYLIARRRGVVPTRHVMRAAVVPGAAFGLNLVFVHLTVSTGAVAVLAILTALQPGLILVLAGRFMGERATAWHIGWTLVAIAATVVVVLGGSDSFEVSVASILYAVIAMLFFTVYFLLTRLHRSTRDIDAVQWMAATVVFAALAVTPWALATSSLDDYRAIAGLDWVWLGFVIVFTGLIGHVTMAWVHRYVQASRSSVYLLAMNVVAIVSAWVVHDEPLSLLQMLAGALVLAAVAAVITRPAVTDAGSVA